MNDAQGKAFKTHFNSVDELIEEVEQKATRLGDRHMLDQSAKLKSMFADDAKLLRIGFEKMKNPDGSLDFKIADDAMDLLKSQMRKP